MSELAADWAPGATPGARPFENDVADLELVGVQFAPEQIDLLEQGSRYRPGPWHDKLNALTVVSLDDPMAPKAWHKKGFEHLRVLGMQALTLDEDMQLSPVVVPAVVEIDCSEYETFDEKEPEWRRFPSLLGRAHVYSPYTGSLLDGLAPHRLWNLWPIDQYDVRMVLEATQTWFANEWNPWLKWLEASKDDRLACHYDGTPEHTHDHEYDDDGFVAACRNGEVWAQHYRLTELVLTEDQELYHKPFGPITGLRHLEDVWNRLVGFSASNVRAALTAYPAWEQREVIRTERHYSPWLWSY